jgi:hypothetical protein
LTFKDLKKRLGLEITQQQHGLFERSYNKPFWIWDIQKHKQQDAKTNGDCCFNHVIGLPQKDGNDKPLYDYEGIIFDSLVTQVGNTSSAFQSWLYTIEILQEKKEATKYTNCGHRYQLTYE